MVRSALSPRVPLRPPWPSRSAPGSPRPPSPRSSTATSGISVVRCPTGPAVAIITGDSDEGRHVLRHSTAHVMAQAVTQLFPGAKFSIGPAIENGFYYDFELPGGKTFSDDDLAAIEAKMGEIVKADQPFVRDELSPADALELFADQPYKCEIIERVVDGRRRQRRRRRDRRRRDHQHLPQHRRVRRSVPRPARAVDRQARPLQADEGRRRVLARQREGSDAATHLRHGVGEQGGARRASASPGGGREARPPQARHRARPAQLPARARRRPRRVASRRGPSSAS